MISVHIISTNIIIAQSAGAVEYTDCRGVTPPMRVLDITLNNLIVKFQ